MEWRDTDDKVVDGWWEIGEYRLQFRVRSAFASQCEVVMVDVVPGTRSLP